MRRDAGLTLIELVLAMSVFALVAVMGLQGLSAMLRAQGQLESRAEAESRLGTALSLLRADLEGLVPLPFQPPAGAPPRSALVFRASAAGAELELSTGHVPRPEAPGQPGSAIGRVTWRLDPASGTLLRREWPRLAPASAGAESPEVAILTDLAALRLRSHWEQIGWVEGAAPTGLGASVSAEIDSDGGSAGQALSSRLPEAVELILVTRSQGEIRLLETLR